MLKKTSIHGTRRYASTLQCSNTGHVLFVATQDVPFAACRAVPLDHFPVEGRRSDVCQVMSGRVGSGRVGSGRVASQRQPLISRDVFVSLLRVRTSYSLLISHAKLANELMS